MKIYSESGGWEKVCSHKKSCMICKNLARIMQIMQIMQGVKRPLQESCNFFLIVYLVVLVYSSCFNVCFTALTVFKKNDSIQLLGKMSEWFKVHAWKACVLKRHRGFESPSFRCSRCHASKCLQTPPGWEQSNGSKIF